MGIKHAALGVYPKQNLSDKVYYANRMNMPFSYHLKGEDGKFIPHKNPMTGEPRRNGRGEIEHRHETVMFTRWITTFSDVGYWCVFVVNKDTPKELANALEEAAVSKKSEIMSEKAFLEFSNPVLAKHLSDTDNLSKEKEKLERDVAVIRAEKGKLEDEINRLKQKAGIK